MNPPINQPADDASLIKPMAVWLVIQLAALAIGCFGVPLSAKRLNPPESLSMVVMAVTQAGVAALLWPMLMRSWRSTLAVLLASLPFFRAAAFLSATPRSETLSSCGILFVWLITLAVLPRESKTTTFMFFSRVVVIAWSIGGAVMAYLAAEFSSPINPALAGPITQILSALQGDNASHAFIVDGALLCAAIIVRAMQSRNRSVRNDTI